MKNSTDDLKVLEFQSLFQCIACYSCLYSVDGIWDAIIAFATWIVAQSAAKSFKWSYSKKRPCNPIFNPGIEDPLEIPSISRNEEPEKSRNGKGSLLLVNTIPMALPEEW